jgi:hypothetical protein
VRRFTHLAAAACSVAMATGGLLASGSELPASASVAAASCTWSVHENGLYVNQYGYDTNKVYFVTNTCGKELQAVIYCTDNRSTHEIDGAVVNSEGSGHASFASCNKVYPLEIAYTYKFN